VDKVVFFLPRFFLPRFLSFLYVFNFFNFLVETKNFFSFCLAGGGIKAGLSEQYITEIYKIGTAD
jgi:ABC-type multidrug transport system permease subunit